MFNTCRSALKVVCSLDREAWQCVMQNTNNRRVKKKLLIRFVMLTNGLLIRYLGSSCNICFTQLYWGKNWREKQMHWMQLFAYWESNGSAHHEKGLFSPSSSLWKNEWMFWHFTAHNFPFCLHFHHKISKYVGNHNWIKKLVKSPFEYARMNVLWHPFEIIASSDYLYTFQFATCN